MAHTSLRSKINYGICKDRWGVCWRAFESNTACTLTMEVKEKEEENEIFTFLQSRGNGTNSVCVEQQPLP